ncbi:hypothetical protein [Actinoplanes sp. GCM10030250]|uniref:hypothetical protein n=1 Tax=Actinoplanes sp. GCM10030250 TaxID=3273376 RepID=UPI0036204217
MVRVLLGLTWSQVLGLSVIAALVTVAGNLVATWLKEYIFARSLEGWKSRQALISVHAKYRDPLLLAAREFKGRVDEIGESYPTTYLRTAVLLAPPAERLLANSVEDEYYKQYRLLSMHYRICSFFGWLELYRQELTFLRASRRRIDKQLEKVIGEIRDDFASGRLNDAPNVHQWTDRLIFKEEQRAIGEGMLTRTSPRTVIGYGSFRLLFLKTKQDADGELWWIRVVSNFLLDLDGDMDFRRCRFQRMQRHLAEAIRLLDGGGSGRRPFLRPW